MLEVLYEWLQEVRPDIMGEKFYYHPGDLNDRGFFSIREYSMVEYQSRTVKETRNLLMWQVDDEIRTQFSIYWDTVGAQSFESPTFIMCHPDFLDIFKSFIDRCISVKPVLFPLSPRNYSILSHLTR